VAASKNNQWWKLRAKHGREKIFSTPEMLWNACMEYFEATDKRKWNKIEYKGTPLKKISIPTDTPYTLTGLCIFLGIGTSTWNDYKNKPEYKDFSDIINQVEDIMFTQKFEGATTGAFNASIIARDLSLVDKSESKTTIIEQPLFPDDIPANEGD
jgi:hypothetical protein